MSKRIAIVAMLALLATTALAQREGCLWWGYHHADNVPESWLGVSMATVYETAIHVEGNASPTQRSAISAVRLPFRDAEHIDSLTLWLTTTLGSEDLASVYVVVAVALIFCGTVLKSDLVWELQDLINQLMVLPNVAALIALSGTVAFAARRK